MRSSLSALKEHVDFYVFISTISVYAFDTPSIDEESNTVPSVVENPDDENAQRPGYGANKKACEALLEMAMPDRHLIARPGVITGPFDITSRITYWLERLQYPGPVVTIRDGSVPVQWIDVRDLSEWVIRMSKARAGGTFNVVGPKCPFLSNELYSTFKQIANSNNEFIFLPIEFVRTLNKWHWPRGCLGICYPEHDNFNQVNNSRAIEKGLLLRSARETFIDTYEWSMKWGHEYYYAVTKDRSLHSPSQEKLEIERSLIGEYDRWRISYAG